MKIANVILTSQNGGAEQVFIDYSRILKKLGHEVILIVKDDAPYASILEAEGFKLHKIKNRFGDHDFLAASAIAKILRDEEIRAAIAHIGRAMVLTNKARRKLQQSPTLFAVNHSDNVKRSLASDFIISINSNIFYRTIDLGRAPQNSFIIPNAIDVADALDPNQTLPNLSSSPEIIIGALGRFDRTKGFDDLIKTIALLKQKGGRKFKLRLAGAGYFENELRQLVSSLGLQDEVEFLGWISDKKSFFASFDIFCLPSRNEPFGLVLLEAMKFCKPIIATNADGPKEILKDGSDALLVARDFPASSQNQNRSVEFRLCEAIEKLAADDDLAKKLVENAAQKLRNRYSFESLEGYLRELFGGRS